MIVFVMGMFSMSFAQKYNTTLSLRTGVNVCNLTPPARTSNMSFPFIGMTITKWDTNSTNYIGARLDASFQVKGANASYSEYYDGYLLTIDENFRTYESSFGGAICYGNSKVYGYIGGDLSYIISAKDNIHINYGGEAYSDNIDMTNEVFPLQANGIVGLHYYLFDIRYTHGFTPQWKHEYNSPKTQSFTFALELPLNHSM